MKADQIIKYLFVSQTRQKLLNIFYKQPQEIFYVRQLVRLTQEEINSVRRELANLIKAGIVTSETRGNRLYYSVNLSNNLFYDLLILAHKTSGLGADLQSSKAGNLKLVLFHHDFVLNPAQINPQSIDMVIIGDASVREVDQMVKKEETQLGREINYMIMDKNELKLRKQKRDPVIIDFFLSCPSVIVGNPKDL